MHGRRPEIRKNKFGTPFEWLHFVLPEKIDEVNSRHGMMVYGRA